MPIPINPSFVSNAVNSIVPNNGTIVSLYDCLKEDEAFVGMQFTFAINPVTKVDMSVGYPSRPLQKISSLYIDASHCTHDAQLFFPATGWGIHIAAGTQFLINDLTQRGDYVFYISLKNQVIVGYDAINVFAMNVNLPFFDTLWQYPHGNSSGSGNVNTSTWFFTNPDAPGPPSSGGYSAKVFYTPLSPPILSFPRLNTGGDIVLQLDWHIASSPSGTGGGFRYQFNIAHLTPPNTDITGALVQNPPSSCVSDFGIPIISVGQISTAQFINGGGPYNGSDGVVTDPSFTFFIEYYSGIFCTTPIG